jgi:excisionase family DNA binding protein
MNNTLFTVEQISSLLNVHPRTIYKWKAQGKIPFVCINGQIRFHRDELESWLHHGKKKIILVDKILRKVLTNPPPTYTDNVKGGKEVARKTKTRHNYGYGFVYVRKTKEGIPRYYIEYYNKSGKRIQRLSKDASNWNEAHEALRDAVCTAFSQKLEVRTQKQKIKFKDFSKIYLNDYAMRKRSWMRTDNVYLKASLIPYFGQYELRKITQHCIEKFVQVRLESEAKKSTINRDLSCLSMVFNKAIEWGYLDEHPMARIKRFPEKNNMRERILSEEEEELLMQHSSEHLKPIIQVAIHTGMRLGEILSLKWSQINLTTQKISVENTKSGKQRIVEINQELNDLLMQICNQSPYVFPNPDTGKPLTTIKRSFRTACKRAGIEDLRFHDLRHTFGTRLIQKGVDIETVRDLMGHHSIVVTQRYLHTNEDRRRQAVESLTHKGTKKVQICYTNCYTGIKSGKSKEGDHPLNAFISMN